MGKIDILHKSSPFLYKIKIVKKCILDFSKLIGKYCGKSEEKEKEREREREREILL